MFGNAHELLISIVIPSKMEKIQSVEKIVNK
jgi:hypothetical protein